MERFVSNYIKKVDAKGRVSVPPAFRTILQRSGDDQIYTQLSLEDQSVIAGGTALQSMMAARLDEMDPFSAEYDDWSAYIFSNCETLKIDGDGRIILTEAIVNHAKIDGEITFAGRGASFHLWRPDAFEDYIAGVRSRVRTARAGGRVS